MECFTELPDNSLSLNVYVQPRASTNRLAGMHGKAIKLCITAPPVDDKANTAVLAFLAKLFGLPKKRVRINTEVRKLLFEEGDSLKENNVGTQITYYSDRSCW